jgi:putative heme-binding domain-containing protein
VVSLCIQLAPYAAVENRNQVRKTLVQCLGNIVERGDSLVKIAFAITQAPSIRTEMGLMLAREIKKTQLDALLEFLRQAINTKPVIPAYYSLLALVSRNDELLKNLALDDSKPDCQISAVRALHFLNDPTPWVLLAKKFRGLSFLVRSEVLKASYSRKLVAKELLQQVKQGRLSWTEFSRDHRNRLQNHRDDDVKRLAREILNIAIPADRIQAYEKYKAALTLKPEATRGKVVFEKTCSSCHQLGNLGLRIGPDISDTRTKSKSQLLLDIIRPNAAIDNNFVEYVVETIDGTVFKGIVIENNATAITLKQADNQSVTVSRENLERLQSSGQSLMPVGLEQGLSLQQVADLISYLQNWRYLDQNIPFEESRNAK